MSGRRQRLINPGQTLDGVLAVEMLMWGGGGGCSASACLIPMKGDAAESRLLSWPPSRPRRASELAAELWIMTPVGTGPRSWGGVSEPRSLPRDAQLQQQQQQRLVELEPGERAQSWKASTTADGFSQTQSSVMRNEKMQQQPPPLQTLPSVLFHFPH